MADSEDDARHDGKDTMPIVVPVALAAAADSSDDEEEDGQSHLPVQQQPPQEIQQAASSSLLPSADDFDSLVSAGGAFLRVNQGPAGAEDASWRLTPAEQAEQAAEARREAAERSAARCSTNLPMNRYGRGLNMLQLGVELSGRAANMRGVDGSGSGKRKAERTHASAVADGEIPESRAGARDGKKGRGNNRTAHEEGWT